MAAVVPSPATLSSLRKMAAQPAAALAFAVLAVAAVVKLRRDRTAQHAVDLSERGTLRLGTRKR